ncbi:MAG TPA: DUF4129 domain-containing protein [Dehalococcoidales bacterium]|nr:DUF4129 domain-containing protein [Dehalococcoidales bacterium]
MKLNWRQGTFYATTIGMEGCWLYALLVLLNNQATDGRLSIFGLLLLYPLAFGLNGLLLWLGWHRVYRDIINVIACGIAILFIIKAQLFSGLVLSDTTWLLALPRAIANIFYAFAPELLILVSSAVLWWLGRRLSRIRVSFVNSVSEFQFGLAILLIVFFIAPLLEVQLANSVLITLAFFLSALLGISIAHAQEGTSWLAGLHQGHWAGLLLVSISLILILGLLISSVITPDFLQLILTALKWVWGLIMKAVAFLISLLPEPSPPEPLPSEALPAPTPAEEPDWSKLFILPEAVRSGLRLGWTIMVLGLMLVFLWRVSSQIFGWLRRRLSTAGAEVEPLSGAFRADLLSLLTRLLSRLLGLRRLLHRQRKPELPEITSIRQIYRQLLHWAAGRGLPRAVFQTPNEYLYILEDALPESGEALRSVTQHYVSARYGLSSPSADELHQLKQSWHQVKQNRPKRPHSEAQP